MGYKNVIVLLMIGLLLVTCQEFKGEKIVLNFKEGYVKILSNNYVIDSIVVSNHTDHYYILGLSDKSEGNNIIFFKKDNPKYTVYKDSLDHHCSKTPAVNSPEMEVFIRQRGIIAKSNQNDFSNIEYFNYNQIPCKSNLTDTIVASNPYR